MNPPRYHQLCWPTPPQRLLLRTLFLPREEAVSAFHQLRAQLDFDRMDGGSLDLMPWLGRRLETLSPGDPILPRLRGALRYHWCRNQLTLQIAREALRLFEDARIPALALKGLALQRLYPVSGLRPMNDVDLLVPPALWSSAEELLLKRGWTSPDPPREKNRNAPHGRTFLRAGRQLDLHAFSLLEDLRAEGDLPLFEHKQRLREPLDSFEAPRDELLLFHVLVHGARYALNQSILWVPDALLLAKLPHLDWFFFLEHVRKRRLEIPVFETLSYLREDLGLELPEDLLPRLRQPPESLFWAEYARWASPRGRVSSTLHAVALVCQRRRVSLADAGAQLTQCE